MNFNVTSPMSFSGKYKLNANQKMPNNDACYMRDMAVGFWTSQAKNGNAVQKQLEDFYMGDYEKDKTAPCDVVLELSDNQDKEFEQAMNMVGQKFSRLA